MTDDVLIKKIGEMINSKLNTAITNAITPVKELVEVINHKIRSMEMFQNVAAEQARAIRDQQSVFNKKLDDMKKTQDEMKETIDKHTSITEDQLLPSVITIEDTITGYGDMYKINGDNILRHEQRLAIVENEAPLRCTSERFLFPIKRFFPLPSSAD